MKPRTRLQKVGCICGIFAAIVFTGLLIGAIASANQTDAAPKSGHTPIVQATHTPTKAPTPRPMPTTTPAPTTAPVEATQVTPTPEPTATTPRQLAVTFTQTAPGAISVQTSPDAALRITVHYNCSNHDATSRSLQGTVQADASGAYTWIWDDQSKCGGTITATVTATLGGQIATNAVTF